MRRPRRKYARTLGRQILACIFIVLFIILIKQMDLAIVDTVSLSITAAFHEEVDFSKTMKHMQQALILTQQRIAFTPPYDAVPASTKSETQIYAIGGGTVLELLKEGDSGAVLKLQHGDQAISVYRGIDQCFVKVGDKVRRGQLIATVGDAGANEFQFELWMNGKQVDPQEYIEF